MPYATQEQKTLAIDNGFSIDENIKSGTTFYKKYHTEKFGKVERHIWSFIERNNLRAMWQTADLVNGKFVNHKHYEDDQFENAVTRSLIPSGHPKNYKYISRRGGYENILTLGEIYFGYVEPGIFASDPYLVVYDETGKRLCAAHLSRFEEI